MARESACRKQPIGGGRLGFKRALRKLVPSTAKLTFNRVFRSVVNIADIIPRLTFPEYRTLPPNHLRIRVGVGNRIFNNQSHFLAHARDFWMFVLSEGIATMHSDILDIGVGCGRWAYWLRDYSFFGQRFAGTYVGVDIDEEAIGWCRQNFDEERFRFYVSSDRSVSYNQLGGARPTYRIPLADESFDLVFSCSLMTHLLEAELENYLRESYRLLKTGGVAIHSHFNIDYPPVTYGTRHTFRHRRGNSLIESKVQPEAAAAYGTDFLSDVCRRTGFTSNEIVHGPDGAQEQSILLCRK